MRKPRVRLRRGPRRCPLCRVEVLSDAEIYTCAGCQVGYHRDCALELGGCATLGCDRVGVSPDAPTPTIQTRRARFGRLRDAARERRRRDRRPMRDRHRAELLEARANPATRPPPDRHNVEPYFTGSTLATVLQFAFEMVFNCLIFAVLLLAGLVQIVASSV